ncbi:MAG: glycosyltransferase family 39 protein [Bacteroidota bacterium]
MMMKVNPKDRLLLLILLFAATTRFFGYNSWSLTNDELSALLGISYGGLYKNITEYVFTDFHPAGLQVLIWCWCKIFGTSETALRLPFVLMGTAAVYLTYLNARYWFNYYAAVMIAATLAVTQFAILYSQIARPYSSGLFFVALTLYGWNRFVFKTKHQQIGVTAVVLFVMGMLLSMYNHYFSFLMVALIGLTGVFLVDKEIRKVYLICGGIAVALFLPHLQITIHQFSAGGIGWVATPDSSYFKAFTLYAFNQSKWYLIFILITALIAFIKLPIKPLNLRFSVIALIWFLTPLLTAYFYSVYVTPVLQHSIIIFSFPFLLFFIFSFTAYNQKWVFVLVPLILIVGCIQIYAMNHFNGSNEFARFKEIAQHINDADNKYGTKNITRAMNVTDASYINYYLLRLNNKSPFVFYHNKGREESITALKFIEAAQTPYFMYCWSNSDCPPEITNLVRNKYPYLIEQQLYFNCEYYLFSNNPSDSLYQIKNKVNEFVQDYDHQPGYFSNASITGKDSTEAAFNQFEVMNDKVEYSSTFSLPLKEMINSSSDIIHAKVSIRPQSAEDDALIVFSINHGDENYYWAGFNVKTFLRKVGDWNDCYFSVRLPIIKSADDKISIYVYNQNKKHIQLDNFMIKVEQGNENLYGLRKDHFLFSHSKN